MNGYQRRLIMNELEITPEQDFILGLVYEKRVILAGDILRECMSLKVASHATAHKYFKDLVTRGFLQYEKGKDNRYKSIFLNSKGVTYMERTK